MILSLSKLRFVTSTGEKTIDNILRGDEIEAMILSHGDFIPTKIKVIGMKSHSFIVTGINTIYSNTEENLFLTPLHKIMENGREGECFRSQSFAMRKDFLGKRVVGYVLIFEDGISNAFIKIGDVIIFI